MKDKIVKFVKQWLPWILSIIFIVLFSISARTCRENSIRSESNYHALVDSITYYQSQMGALVASKTAFESNIKELKLVNSKLYEEIEDMRIKLSKVSNAVHVEGKIDFGETDTIYLIQRDTIDNSFRQDFDFSNKWRLLNGTVAVNNDSMKMNISKDLVILDYTVAMDENNKIYIKSNNPYVLFDEISGFTVPKPKRTHFSIGPSVGVGYGVFNRKPDLFVGVNVTWNLFEF